ncbi:GyrI-like domain-containing protein [Paenarthrobacter sp. JL.01a]|uniref:GyrI-like domain-containing protein n=1 Tax=Paenarthrobacter sp. JL.01a TaxID=2979324 RepID=UPI0021C87E11|nr:GyrI-like domain-containing protein [Paenarthrobacter sp. JL.01a]UXM91755.1 GyrI-like domain-containing protein [Paenarthrobacter sp. JL.01a]
MKSHFKKLIPSYSATKGAFSLVSVPPLQYLKIDGSGDPNTAASYKDALSTMYPVAYKLKFFSKGELGQDYGVMPLEALWWADDMDAFTSARDKSLWEWTLMNMVPDWITQEHFDAACSQVAKKGAAPALERLRLERLEEGLSVQTLHVGPYDDEGPVLEEMHHRFIPQHSLRMTGKHHEIYLGDPRRTAPEKLRTILRQPVAPTAE